MRLNKYIFLLFFIIFSYSFGQNPLTTEDRINQKIWVDSTYNSLSSDEKIGQLFTIWVATKQGPEQMDKVAEKIKKNHLGGLIFSLGNIKDQAKYTNKFHDSLSTDFNEKNQSRNLIAQSSLSIICFFLFWTSCQLWNIKVIFPIIGNIHASKY